MAVVFRCTKMEHKTVNFLFFQLLYDVWDLRAVHKVLTVVIIQKSLYQKGARIIIVMLLACPVPICMQFICIYIKHPCLGVDDTNIVILTSDKII